MRGRGRKRKRERKEKKERREGRRKAGREEGREHKEIKKKRGKENGWDGMMGWEESSPGHLLSILLLREHLVELRRIKNKQTGRSPRMFRFRKSHSNPTRGPGLPYIMREDTIVN